jgi:hypothetical protein
MHDVHPEATPADAGVGEQHRDEQAGLHPDERKSRIGRIGYWQGPAELMIAPDTPRQTPQLVWRSG